MKCKGRKTAVCIVTALNGGVGKQVLMENECWFLVDLLYNKNVAVARRCGQALLATYYC